ncbi:hypothetical protein AMAG_05395 [Allomyces macrogynus ATCC 38327]|uniref:Ubiquitin-like domain-containing protein n=1 Tax=Allomyces macrogynus (strain ATCC 38327) TaxID=578462 RepID=A0A0L0SC00_ALLM3|nr:hypothetical protein AMAG_05395 [Allomyces macrogynus ATCC 38327]|eukprot:KNE59949.1 hypothetical protein AMAG_05395 [Allomyces macrogynus ATCC 38327]
MSSTRAAGSRARDDNDNDSLPPLVGVSDSDANDGHASDADSLPPLVDADHRDGSAGSNEDYDDEDGEPELEPWCTCGECYVGGEDHEYTDEEDDEEDDDDYTDEDDEDDEHDHDWLCDHHYEQVTGRQRNGSSSNSNGASASSSNRPSASGSSAGAGSSSSTPAPATSDPSFPSKPMKLGVKFLRPQGSEEVFDLTLPGNVTIMALRAAVAEKIKIEPALARLIFRGRVLQDGKAAHEYGLEDNMTLHLVTKPPPESAASGSSNGNPPNSLNSRTASATANGGRASSSNGAGNVR